MPRMPVEFVRFVAAHYPLVSALCRLGGGLGSDDEIAAFLRSHLEMDAVGGKINEMKRLGVVTQSTGEWSPPPFLVKFIASLDDRHTLATPAVVLAWVASFDGLAGELARLLDRCALAGRSVDEERTSELLREIGDAIHVVGATVAENIARISLEVTQYRATEDAARMRSRLLRLTVLYEKYLTPIMGILETGGRFRAATQQVILLCARLASGTDLATARLADDARHLRQHVTSLRRSILIQADEANAELAPLCTAALRESLIARGVNRALEAIRQGDWDALALGPGLPVVVDLDAALTGDDAIAAYLQQAFRLRDQKPPRVVPIEPRMIPIPWTPQRALDRLQQEPEVADVLDWLMRNCAGGELPDSPSTAEVSNAIDSLVACDASVKLLHGLIDIGRQRMTPADVRREYAFKHVSVTTHAWKWSAAGG